MSLSFKKQTEEQVLNLLPAGTYSFQVAAAHEQVSKAGNDMIKLTLIIWDNAGFEHIITDYLMEKMMYKLKHFCDATGLEDKYEAETLTADDCVNQGGQCKIKIDEGSEGYGPKNVIQDYVKADKASPKEKAGTVSSVGAKSDEEFFNDSIDVPF